MTSSWPFTVEECVEGDKIDHSNSYTIAEINESLRVDTHTCICGVPFCTNMLCPLPKILLVLETTHAPTGRPPSEKPCRASSRAASQPGDCLRDSILSGDVIFGPQGHEIRRLRPMVIPP